MMKYNAILICLLIAINCGYSQSLQELFNAGTKAYEEQDYPQFLHYIEKADSLRPNHPIILQNLGTALALNFKKYEAVQVLKRTAYMNADINLDNPDFINLQDFTPFESLKDKIDSLKATVKNSALAFTLTDKNFHPEGITYSEKYKSYFVGSVRQKKIIRINDKGEMLEFASDVSLWAVMGLAVDNEKQLLWACSTAAPEMLDYSEELNGKAEIVCFDIKSEKLLGRYPVKDKAAWLGDLVIAPNGEVFTTSSNAEYPTIYKVNRKSGIAEEWLPLEQLISLQGLTFDTDSQHLFFSDYRYGIFKVDLVTKTLFKLKNETEHPLKGIDGLYYLNGKLIGICNGLSPFQVVQFSLSKKEESILELTYLDKALPEMGEPTLGVIKDNELFYIANSPWGAYDKNKNLIQEKVKEGIILKLKL